VSKPRIKYIRSIDQWKCVGEGITELGNSPAASYIYWRLKRDQQAAGAIGLFENMREKYAKTEYFHY
jgi:hypothetical protein